MSSAIQPTELPATQDFEEKTEARAASIHIREAPMQLNLDSQPPIKPIQPGVAKIEHVTKTWNKTSLWAVFVS